ncbi:MAG TPA: hypothetical protein VG838_16615 [Opitutaceae bacterium]|nr:hypothetical protein [Opitutaceae bacterium]
MRSKGFTWILTLAVLLAAGFIARLVAGDETAEEWAGGRCKGEGGFRTLLADFLWMHAHVSWERRQPEATVRALRLTVAADPRPLAFWLNGARMIAYDMPRWRLGGLDAPGQRLPDLHKRLEQQQGRRALEWLDDAARVHPDAPAVFIERANILLNCEHDLEGAAANYRRAALLPRAPFYAARLHAELLRRLGRREEALAWLAHLHPRLPRGDAAAAAGLVEARIRELETELGVPPERRYRVPEDRRRPGEGIGL